MILRDNHSRKKSMVKKAIAESVAATNEMVLGNAAAFYQNMQMSNAVSHQQAMNQLELAITAKMAQIILSGNNDGADGNVAALMSMLKEIKHTSPSSNS